MVAVGSPLVDVLVNVHDAQLARTGLVKGSMELVDLERGRELYEALGPAVEVSGGSAANTAAGVAALGGTVGFVGKVAEDELGEVFTHDIRAAGVEYVRSPSPAAGPAEKGAEPLGTGRCLVLVGDDAERTMATYLGVAVTISPADVPLELVARGRLIYLEGYLWDLPPAKAAMRRAIGEAHRNDGAVVLSLSDSFCVARHDTNSSSCWSATWTSSSATRRRSWSCSAPGHSTSRSRPPKRRVCSWPSPGEPQARWWSPSGSDRDSGGAGGSSGRHHRCG